MEPIEALERKGPKLNGKVNPVLLADLPLNTGRGWGAIPPVCEKPVQPEHILCILVAHVQVEPSAVSPSLRVTVP